MTTKATKKTPETAPKVQMRSVPERAERPASSASQIIEALGGMDIPEGQAVVVTTLATRKSALSTASKLRRKYADVEFIALGEEVLARPKTAAVAKVAPKVVAVKPKD